LISGGRTAPAATSWPMRSSGGRERPTAGRKDLTSLRSGFGAAGPDAIKAARPPGRNTANDCLTWRRKVTLRYKLVLFGYPLVRLSHTLNTTGTHRLLASEAE
jgi:hypothetical protein